MDFTVYNVATGDVRSGECPEDDLALQPGIGEALWPVAEKLDDTKWKIIGGSKVPIDIDLAALERELLARIDRTADDVHGRVLPKSMSLIEVHRAKKAEALAIAADPEIDAAQTPRLSLEAESAGMSREACALVVLARAAEDEAVSARIDDIRRIGKSAVRAAETEAGKRAAAAAVDWSPVTG